MPKITKELSALSVSRLNQPGDYAVEGVSGFYFQINGGSKSLHVFNCIDHDDLFSERFFIFITKLRAFNNRFVDLQQVIHNGYLQMHFLL